MNLFSSHWLSLREPVDLGARNNSVLNAINDYFRNREEISVTDIAGGTGSTLRALQEKLAVRANWRLLDNDPTLLSHAQATFKHGNTTVEQVDLAQTLEPVLDTNPDLVTTSAFLDLVSQTWLEHLVDLLAHNNTPFYAAITYNGNKSLSPVHPLDAAVCELFDMHQKTDKGFGPAMGPSSAQQSVETFRNAGFVVDTGSSDWCVEGNHHEFQHQLLTGWHQAALELSPETKTELDEWLQFRMRMIRTGKSRLIVGHTDFFARLNRS